MTTYIIVSKDKDPLGPGEVSAAEGITVADGDVFVVDPSVDSNITYQPGGGTADFDIVFTASNASGFKITVTDGLTPDIMLGEGVNLSQVDFDLKDADATALTAGHNVSLGKFEGSEDGPNTLMIGDGFATTEDWKLGEAGDSVTIGDNANIQILDTSGGNDTIRLGKNAQVSKVEGGEGNDTLYTATTGVTQSNVETTLIVCYAPETLIDTPAGPLRIDGLRAGDLVDTLDGGPCPVRWVRSHAQRLDGADDAQRPVLIQRGALGPGLPRADLIVSPQHRVLVGGAGQLEHLFASQALVPAKALTSLAGVRHMRGKQRMTWVHFALDRHHIVRANGLCAETLFLGPMVLRGMSMKSRAAFTLYFGTALPDGAALNAPPARALWTVAATRRHLRQAGERARLGNRMATHAF